MRKSVFVLITAMLLCLFVTPACAQSENPRLVDGGDILTDSQEKSLLAKLDGISEEHQYDTVIVTADTLGGKSAYGFAKDTFLDGGYGMGENKSGVILIVSMREREWYIEFFGDERLPEGTDLSDYFLNDLKNGDYYSAFDSFADAVDSEQSFPFVRCVVIAVIIAVIVALAVTSVMKGKLKSVRFQHNAREYVRQGSLKLNHSRDLYLYSTITRIPRPKNNGGGGGSRGGGGRF